MDQLPEAISPWQAISYVTSGLTLVAFISLVVIWLFRVYRDYMKEIIDKAPEEKREALIASAINDAPKIFIGIVLLLFLLSVFAIYRARTI